MTLELALFLIAAILALAGFVKGVIGFGLPSVGMGLLTLLMTPAQAAALLLAPNVVTNIWQGLAGPALKPLLRRMIPLLAGTLVGIAATEWLTGGKELRFAVRLLGLTLAAYALLGLLNRRFDIPASREGLFGWLAGLATGAMTALTGVYVIPAGPYLQSIGLQKDELVQALGLSFLVASIGLGVALWTRGAIQHKAMGATALALLPVAAAMLLGQKARGRMPEQTFRRVFFLGMLALGLWLAIRG
jgi:uncharacterized protein